MKRIVVGLDGSPESTRALDSAADLALLTGAEITAVSVLDVKSSMSWTMAPTYVPDYAQLDAELRQNLESWCEPLRQRSVPYRALVRQGQAAAELLAEASGAPTDLIVVGSRGRGGFRELLLGSVAHSVTQHAKTPVLVVPRLAAEAETPVGAPATA